MSLAYAPAREKRRKVFLLRGMLLVAVGGLLIKAGVAAAGFGSLALVLALAFSNVLLLFAPPALVCALSFELGIGAVDLMAVALGIHLAGASSGALPVSCLLMVLVVSLTNYRVRTVAGAAAVGAMHAWLVLGNHADAAAVRDLGLQVLFLCSVGLYYGYLVDGIHRLRRKAETDGLERREITALLDILDTVTSSLDLQNVMRALVQKITAVVPAMRCSVIFINDARTRCYVMASHDNPDLNMLELNLDRYPEIRSAIDKKSAVVVQDVDSDPLMDEVRGYLTDIRSIMVIPIAFGDEVLGTLCLKSARSATMFSPMEINFCKAVARVSANALQNAMLHREVQDQSGLHLEAGKQLESILNHSPDLILTTDIEGRITEFNRGGELLLGYGKEEVLGQPCGTLLVGDEGARMVEEICSKGTSSTLSCRLRHQDGSEKPLELNTAALKNDKGSAVGTVWIGRDVSELKAAQMKLLQAEKLSAIGEVISGVAHELNNPLSGVLGFSQILMSRYGDSPMVRELERINESAQRCQKIVKNLLSFARVHKPEKKYLGVNGILRKTLDLKEYQLRVNGIEVTQELPADLPRTMLDFHQMQQVFLNLVNNAEQAMTAVSDRPGRLQVRTRMAEGRIRVEIGDNGEGIDTQVLNKIFDPFFTTKEQGEGTGLGLSVSYGIIREHGGRISAESRQGVGTTFTIELPVRKPEVEEMQPAENLSDSVADLGSGKRILVVDDEPVVADLLFEILQESGHQVDTAANGKEACRKVQGGTYDLLITDIRMPQMNGIELYKYVLTVRPELDGKVVFITGDLLDEDTVRFLAQVRAPVIAKPPEVADVCRIIKDTLDTPPVH